MKLTRPVGTNCAVTVNKPVILEVTALLRVMLRFGLIATTVVPAGIPGPVTVAPTVMLPVWVVMTGEPMVKPYAATFSPVRAIGVAALRVKLVLAVMAVIVPRLTLVELMTVWPTKSPDVFVCGTTVTPARTVPLTVSGSCTATLRLFAPSTPTETWKAPVVS